VRALLLKELRALLPVYIVIFLLISGDFLMRPFSERLDEASWSDISSNLTSDQGFYAVVMLILALIVAYAAFPREHDDRTIELLYSLPISRRAVFVAKALAGMTVLVIGVAGGAVTDALLASPNPQSFSGEQFQLDIALTTVFLRGGFAVIVYCHALFASFFRRVGLIPFMGVAYGLVTFQDAVPDLAILDPSTMTDLTYDGQTLLIPWDVIGVHVPLALVSLVAAGVLWTRGGEHTAYLMDRAQRTVVGRVGLGCATAAVVVTGIVVFTIFSVQSAGEEDPSEPPKIEYVSFASATAETDHFHFTYPVNLRGRAMPLVARSEELYGGLGEILGMAERPEATIDLTEASSEHLGIASWTRVRVGLVLHPDAIDLEHTVTHELAHVLQHHLSDRRINDARRATALFVEGSAEHLAYEVVDRPAVRASSRRIAATMWERHHLELDELLDHDRMQQSWDARLAYYVGEVFTEALVDACGPDAVGRTLRAMARPDAPHDLEPAAFWRDTLQAVSCSFESVRASFDRILGEVAEAERAYIDAIPRPSGGVVGPAATGAAVLITLDRPLPPGGRVVVSVRRHAGVGDSEVSSAVARPRVDEPLRFDADVPIPFGAESFQFELGVQASQDEWAVYETWRTAQVSW